MESSLKFLTKYGVFQNTNLLTLELLREKSNLKYFSELIQKIKFEGGWNSMIF